MPIRTQCPRCKQPLAVPEKLAGSYVNCPRCQGRFWVAKDALVEPGPSDSVAAPPVSLPTWSGVQPAVATMPPPAAIAMPPTVAARSSGPSVIDVAPAANDIAIPTRDAAKSQAVAPPDPPPVVAPNAQAPTTLVATGAPPIARKVARLVTAESAQSNVLLAADGQLPHLQLVEINKKDAGSGKAKAVNPLLVLAAVILSCGLSVAIVLFSDDESSGARSRRKSEAVQEIEDKFFGMPPLLPYQVWLRNARQAECRGDHKAENDFYRKVLDVLRVESKTGRTTSIGASAHEAGVTGSHDNDLKLEQLIITATGDEE